MHYKIKCSQTNEYGEHKTRQLNVMKIQLDCSSQMAHSHAYMRRMKIQNDLKRQKDALHTPNKIKNGNMKLSTAQNSRENLQCDSQCMQSGCNGEKIPDTLGKIEM